MAELELLASGYGTVEGPTVDVHGALYFSDVTGGGVFGWSPPADVKLVVPKRKGVGGICLHENGGIVVSGRSIAHVKDGATRTLFSREDAAALSPAGGVVGGFNDIHADDRGNILAGVVRLTADGGRLAGELIQIVGEGRGTLLYDGVEGTNGIALDWSTRRLYHCASHSREVIISAFADGHAEIVKRVSTADIGGVPDGVALDVEGCFWVAFFGGACIVRYDPKGRVLKRLPIPANEVTSLCFGGADGCDLFVVSEDNIAKPELRGCVFRTRSEVAGGRVGVARI